MATSSKFIVYALQDPNTLEIRYIGKSCSGYSRIRRHFSSSEQKVDKNCHKVNWIKSIQRQGKLPNIIIVQQLFDHKQVEQAEKYWIEYFFNSGCPLLNITKGGENYKLSDSTIQKLRESSKKLHLDPEFKKRHSEGIKLAMEKTNYRLKKSIQFKKMWENPEYRKRKCHSVKMQHQKPEYKATIGEKISKGKLKNTKKIIDSNGIIYDSMKDAAKKTGLPYLTIYGCANKLYKKPRELNFYFLNESLNVNN